MSASSPDLPRGDERQPAGDETHSPILPLKTADPMDGAATIISKHAPRPLTNDEALNGIRGRKLAHFELIDRIGVGGMAAVLRARDTQLDRLVALKILPPDMALDEENVRRFHQEARSAAKLDHENVARVFFCGEDQRLHFIAFEFVEGENLRTLLDHRGRLPVGEALHYMLQVAAGLAHAAQRGVVHRDIKPSNIIITPNGRAKLVDMGLARSMEARHDDDGLTQSGVTLGTFDYISPEQALEPREADVRSDIYSLGCTFYHMLTGRPPVPEGTAARKLHHHQHVKPRDPREVVPGLPDDVAVILDHMLAKQPRDRYQTPQQLVHHLLLAARKIGVAADVPEGVLAMDAVVPNPPRYRPVLLALLTTVAVVVLILVLGQGASTPPHNVGLLGTTPAKPAKDKEPSQPGDNGHAATPNPQQPLAVAPEKARPAVYDADDVTTADLLKWLKDNAKAEELDVRLARDLDDAGGDSRLVFKAAKVSIRPKDPSRPVTVRLTYDPNAARASTVSRAGFTVDSKDATVEGLSFLIDARGEDEALVGLQCAAGGSYRVNRCQFVQANAPRQTDQKHGLASVVVDGSAAGRTRLALSECSFLGFGELSKSPGEPNQPDVLQLHEAERGGYEAVVRRGPAQVEAVNCAFGPHESVFRLEGKSGPNEVLVQHCSVLAGRRTTVFAFADEAGAALKVKYSLFSRPGDGDGEPDKAVFVRQTANAGAVTWEERDNRYHHLDAYWVGAGLSPKIPQEPSRELDANPWKDEHPLARLEALRFADPAAKAGDPALGTGRQAQIGTAFQVNFADRLADLQPLDRPRNLIGVEQFGIVSYVANLQPPVVTRKDKERVVDPTVTGSRDGVYSTLSSAVEEAKPGDVILIKHNGDLAIKPVRVEEATADLTIRPYPDYHPTLVLGSTADADASLFRVYDGKVQFEGLEFRLEPKDKNFKAQVVATIIGNGQCGFKNCVATLDPAGLGTALAVVSVADLGGMMKSDTVLPRTQPRVTFETCVVRGQGDLVWDRAGRPFDLEARNTLVVLAGNFLNLEGGTEPTATLVGATLTNVTAYQTGHFIRLRAGKDVKTLPALRITTGSCLFVAAAGHSLIHLEDLEMTEDRLKDRLKELWSVGENGNVYAGFGDMLDQRPRGDEMPQPAIVSKEWKTFTGEMTIKLPRAVKFASAPPPDGPFNRVAPGHFKAMELAGFGADISTLPKPAQTSPDTE